MPDAVRGRFPTSIQSTLRTASAVCQSNPDTDHRAGLSYGSTASQGDPSKVIWLQSATTFYNYLRYKAYELRVL